MVMNRVPIPVPPIGQIEQVSDSLLSRYAELIYARTGIRISPQKKMLLSNRLRRRLAFDRHQDLRGLLRAPEEAAGPRSRMGRLHPGNHDARNLPVPRRIAMELVSQRISSRPCGVAARRAAAVRQPADMVGGVQHRRRGVYRWPAASRPAWIFRDGRFTFSPPTSASGRWSRPKTGVFGQRAMRLVPADYRRRFFTKAQRRRGVDRHRPF